eukprot:jgi/Ulvmu1/8670/UM047_0008.1
MAGRGTGSAQKHGETIAHAEELVNMISRSPVYHSTSSVGHVHTLGVSHDFVVHGYGVARQLHPGSRICSGNFTIAGCTFRLEVFPTGVASPTTTPAAAATATPASAPTASEGKAPVDGNTSNQGSCVAIFLTASGGTACGQLLHDISIVDPAAGSAAIHRSGSITLHSRPPHQRTVVVAHPEFVATSALEPALVRDDAFTVRATLGLVCGATDGDSAIPPPPQRAACCHAAPRQAPAELPLPVELAQPGQLSPRAAPAAHSVPQQCLRAGEGCSEPRWVAGCAGGAPMWPAGAACCAMGASGYGAGPMMGIPRGHAVGGLPQWPVLMLPGVPHGHAAHTGGLPVSACVRPHDAGAVAWVPVRLGGPPAAAAAARAGVAVHEAAGGRA